MHEQRHDLWNDDSAAAAAHGQARPGRGARFRRGVFAD